MSPVNAHGRWERPIAKLVRALASGLIGLTAVSAWAQQSPPRNVFIGRVQVAAQSNHIVRVSQSVFAANPDGLFVLEAIDHNHDARRDEAALTRLQIYYGGPLPANDPKSWLGWVGRLEAVEARPSTHLSDARWGLQVTAQRLPGMSSWFRQHNADFFVQVFPLRTNQDFGRWDVFARFSKRFAPNVVSRGFVRAFRLDQGTAVVFENDLIYEIRRDMDVFARVGWGNREVPGISERRWSFGIGARFNF